MTKPKKPELALDNTTVLVVTVEGVPVCLRVDEHGRPLTASACIQHADHERLVRLAVRHAHQLAASGATRVKRKDDTAKAAANSAKVRAAEKHWTNFWFDKTHRERPKFGRDLLAAHAQRNAAQAGISDPKKLSEFTPQRARQFLDRVRNAERESATRSETG